MKRFREPLDKITVRNNYLSHYCASFSEVIYDLENRLFLYLSYRRGGIVMIACVSAIKHEVNIQSLEDMSEVMLKRVTSELNPQT